MVARNVSRTISIMGRRGVAVSILACQAKGRGFKSRRLRTQHLPVLTLIEMGQLIRQLTHFCIHANYSLCVFASFIVGTP